VRVLTRREKKGHTGVFLKKEVSFDETIESVLFMLAKNKSLIRKKLSGL
jgi:predicted nucleotidyltransferase